MENKKQNSIDWLVDQIEKDANVRLRGLNLNNLLEQAKAMHMKEIKEAVDFSNKKWTSMKVEVILNGQQYYNETFGGQDNG